MKLFILFFVLQLFCFVRAQQVAKVPEEIIAEDEDEIIFDIPLPEFPGGLDSLYSYVAINFLDKIVPIKRDTIIAQFMIKNDGTVMNVTIQQGDLTEQQKEILIELLKNMPSWSNTRGGDVKWTLPFILFADDEDRKKHQYELALQHLSCPVISFKDAVFTVENMFYDGELNYEFYNERLSFYKNLTEMISFNSTIFYDFSDSISVSRHAALFKLMTDTIPIQIDESTMVYHFPFKYNFDDYAGKKDWSSMFVSTLLETQRGNCHSLPILYKLIAEEMGEKAWLALAPNHIYIKLQNKQSGWYNTELTSGNFPTDPYIKSSGYIHLDAIQNGIYMDTLSTKQSIALCMVDLALGYKNKYPDTYDPDFVLRCCDKALDYFPDFINALLLQASTRYQLYQGASVQDANKLKEIEALYAHIHNLGYRKMPEEMYLKWLESLKAFK